MKVFLWKNLCKKNQERKKINKTNILHLDGGSATRSPMFEYIDLGVKWEHLIIGHTHHLSSKWGCHFLIKHLMWSHLVELLVPMTWSKASWRCENIPWACCWLVHVIELMVNARGIWIWSIASSCVVHIPTWVIQATKYSSVSKMTRVKYQSYIYCQKDMWRSCSLNSTSQRTRYLANDKITQDLSLLQSCGMWLIQVPTRS
jgi:hypothetical protein